MYAPLNLADSRTSYDSTWRLHKIKDTFTHKTKPRGFRSMWDKTKTEKINVSIRSPP